MIQKILPVAIISFLAVFPLASSAQQPDYFPNRLIIKYESEQKLQHIRAKQKADPQAAVQQILSRNGARRMQHLLPENLRKTIRRRGLPSSSDVLRIQEVTFGRRIDPPQLAAKISAMPGVEYAEPKYIRKLSFTPSDSVIEKYVDTHNFTEGWDLSQGSPEITIAIVDGGVGYTHPDLDDKLWINQDEIPTTVRSQADQDGNGTVTSTEIKQYLQQNGSDYNGDGTITLEDALHDNSSFTDNLDNDKNGFTNDLFGWDFWASGGVGNPVATDNNPIHDATDHGTHVAGIAAAETDNGEDIAGAGFNTNYMAVKAGGTPENPDVIGFGFEGIIYAAENGADVINCSWGGGSASEAEQDIINLATDMGALVVAASGNETSSQLNYPGGYDRVLSVGAIASGGTVAPYSNYGYRLDVLATGSDILSTSYDNGLTVKSGTSMSTPVASGLAALLKDLHPGWSPDRIGIQIRTSASYIDNTNSSTYENKLGHGSIDAFNALNTDKPGLKVVSYEFVEQDGEKLGISEPGTIEVRLANIGDESPGPTLRLESLNDGGLELRSASRQLGTMATGDTVSVTFGLTISNSFNLNEVPTLRLNFEGTNYSDFGILRYEDLLYDILAGNNVKTSLAADGSVGFTDPLSGMGGVGFIPRSPDGSGGYQEGDNLLFEGGLMLEIDGEMHDAVRADEGLSRDFIPRQVFTTQSYSNGSGLTGSARFVTDTDSARRAIIDLETYALDDPELSNVVFLKYTIRNPSSFVVLEKIYAGLFNDWDIGSNSSNNSVSFSEADSVLYLYDASSNSTQPKVAVAHLGPISAALAIDNTIEGQQDSVTFGLYDGFIDTEKSNAITAGTVRTSIEHTDVSAVTASGPYTLNPQAEITVGFVYAFGDDLGELRSQIAEARSRNLFSVSPTGKAVSETVPQQTKLYQNYPNPFRNSTRIRLDLQQTTKVTLTIFNVLGRKVRVVVDEELQAGSHFLRFRSRQLSSGVYFMRLNTGQGTQTIPMTLIN